MWWGTGMATGTDSSGGSPGSGEFGESLSHRWDDADEAPFSRSSDSTWEDGSGSGGRSHSPSTSLSPSRSPPSSLPSTSGPPSPHALPHSMGDFLSWMAYWHAGHTGHAGHAGHPGQRKGVDGGAKIGRGGIPEEDPAHWHGAHSAGGHAGERTGECQGVEGAGGRERSVPCVGGAHGVVPKGSPGAAERVALWEKADMEKTRSWVERVECLHADVTRGLHADVMTSLHSDVTSESGGEGDFLKGRHLLHRGTPCRVGCPAAPGPGTGPVTGSVAGFVAGSVAGALSGRAVGGSVSVSDPGSDHGSWRSAKGRVPERLWRSRSSEDMLATLCERKGPSGRRREGQQESSPQGEAQAQAGAEQEDEDSDPLSQSQSQSQSQAQAGSDWERVAGARGEGRGCARGVHRDSDEHQLQPRRHRNHLPGQNVRVQQQNHHHQQQQQEQEQGKERAGKLVSMRARLLSTAWMVSAFGLVVHQGPLAVWGLVLCLQALIAGELFALAPRCIDAQSEVSDSAAPSGRDAQLEQPVTPTAGPADGPREQRTSGTPVSSLLNWQWAVTAAVFMYGRLLQPQIVASASAPWAAAVPGLPALLLAFVRYHGFLSFSLYFAGFVAFVLSLKPGQYRAQFAALAWAHMAVFFAVVQSSFFVANAYQGMIWFLLPTSLVIVNDCAAYVFGVLFGRTPLIQLSPKKTWEGYLGAAATTSVAAFLLAGMMGQVNWLTCPRKELGWGHGPACVPHSMFEPRAIALPLWLQPSLPAQMHVLWASEAQWHALALGAFASILAPFGGFFASGLKRALQIKDFGSLIPGHGGVTDRFDCQLMTAAFSYVYFHAFIAPRTVQMDGLVTQLLALSPEHLREVHGRLSAML